jgi:hypothetical protein
MVQWLFFVFSCRVIIQINQRISSKQLESERLMKKVTENPDPNAMEKATDRHNKMRNAWVQRKVQCMEAIDMLAEGTGKKLKVLLVSRLLALLFFNLLAPLLAVRKNYQWKQMMQLANRQFHC